MNTITELLNLEDSDILISDISVQGTTKTLTLKTFTLLSYLQIQNAFQRCQTTDYQTSCLTGQL